MTTASRTAAKYYQEGIHTQTDSNTQGPCNGVVGPRQAAIYARSATDDQTGDNRLPLQLDMCRRYCLEQGYTLQEKHIYQEICSGMEYKARPQLSALREAAQRHEFDVVVVYAYNRLSRNHMHLGIIIGDLKQLDIDVESMSDPGADSVIDDLLRQAHDFAQQIEREKIIARMKKGREVARRQREQQ